MITETAAGASRPHGATSWTTRVCIAFVLLAALVYWPMHEAGFIWDDDDYVTQNPVLRDWSGLWRIWTEPRSLPQYYPLVHSTFWLEFRLWGLAPLGYHVVNVLLHALSAVLIWRLCLRLALPGAMFAALWFLVHPVHVESVAWVTERKNVLSLACALAAAHAWLSAYDGGRRRDHVVATAWFVAALLAKTVTATLPAALLVVVWWRDGRLPARAWRSLGPWFLLGAGLAYVTVHLEATHVQAAGTPWQLAGAERLLVAGRAPWFYLGCLVWPVGLCFNYPRWQLDTGSLLQWAWPIATAVVLAVAFRFRRRRGPLTVLLLFGGMLTPALGLFDVFPFRYSFVADHFQYHASVPVLVGLAAFVAGRAGGWPRPVLPAVCVVLFGAQLALSWRLQAAYRDPETLWRETLSCNEGSTLALVNLGGIFNERRDYAAAKPLFERALAIDATLHEAHNNLGVIAHAGGDRATARALYERSLELDPDDVGSLANLAVLHLDEQRPDEALPLAERAVRIEPSHIAARVALARALSAKSRWEPAIEHCDYVLRRLPDRVDVRELAANGLARLGRHRQASSNAMVCLRAVPESSRLRSLVVATLTEVLKETPVASVRAMAVGAMRNSGIDPAPLLPLVADALRAAGDEERAGALLGG